MQTNLELKIKSVLFGVAVGDALGVPVEFKSREYLARNPVSDMQGYGTHNWKPASAAARSKMKCCCS